MLQSKPPTDTPPTSRLATRRFSLSALERERSADRSCEQDISFDPTHGAKNDDAWRHGIRGVVFEPRNVFYDATLWRRWLLQLLSRLGLHAHYESFFHVWEVDFHRDVWRGHREHDEALQAFLLSAGLTRAQIDEVEAASHAKRRELDACQRLLPGVCSTLQSLRAAELRMCILSDADCSAEQLAGRMQTLGLGGLLDAVVSSFDLERAKPDQQCYHAALDALQLAPHETLFVGQQPDEIAGARVAGLRAMTFDPSDSNADDDRLLRIEELSKLLPGVTNHRSRTRRVHA